MQNVAKGRLLEVATKLYLEKEGFTVYFWQEWALQNKENREILINGKVKVQGIPEFAFECRVGNYPPIRWVSEYLVREEDKDTGIVWDPMLRVEEFVDIVKKLIAFSGRCLEIKQQMREVYEGSNPVKTV